MKHLLFLLILFFYTHTLCAQSIAGRVLDQQTRQPLTGVNVIVPGTTIGTATNAEGYFKLKLKNMTDSLHVSHIGYMDQRIQIQKQQELLHILLQPNDIALNELQVVGFSRNHTLQETGASIALVTAQDLKSGNRVGLSGVLNTIAGIQVDQSRVGESRISIRGAGITAPWGIRDLKIYMNNIPITQANGVARIEAIDVATLGRIEVIKGPASSIYGAGTGGVISFKPKIGSYGQSSVEANTLFGSYGLSRTGLTYQTGTNTFNALVTLGNQTYDGYRQHSHDLRRFFTGSFLYFPSQEQTLTVLVSRSRQETQIPGSLNAEQVTQNPRQAAQSNIAKQAGRYQSWTRIGISHSYDFSDRINNSSSVFTSFYKLEHPLAFAYLNNNLQRYGGRTVFTFQPYTGVVPFTFTVGGEYQNGFGFVNHFVNEGGNRGSLILNQRRHNTNYFVFAQAEVELTNATTLTAGLSYNNIRYEIRDAMGQSLPKVKEFDGVWAPRLALVHVFNESIALRSSISYGFSPPSTGQITDADGQFRPEVQAEKGINYEVGARGRLLEGKLSYDVALFSFQMKDLLVPQVVDQNNTIYNNAGETSKLGLEAVLSYGWTAPASFIHSFHPFVSYTYSHFNFEDYRLLGASGEVLNDYTGNAVTGISPHRLAMGIDIETIAGFYFNTTYYFTGKAPINDGNTVYNDAYSLLNSKVGFESLIGKHFKIDINAGVKNALNTQYSAHIALNARSFGGSLPAYYSPAPDRNFYSSLSVSYLF